VQPATIPCSRPRLRSRAVCLHHHATPSITRYPSCTVEPCVSLDCISCQQTAFLLHPVPDLCFPPSSVFHHTPPTTPAPSRIIPPRSRRATRAASPATFRRHIGSPGYAHRNSRWPLTRPATRAKRIPALLVSTLSHTRTLCKRPSQPARRPAPSRPPSLSLSPSVSNARSTLRRPVCRAAPDPAPAAATASNLTGSALLSCVFKPFTRGPPADPDRTSSLGPPLPCPHRYRRAVLQPPVALYGVAREGLVCLCLRQGVPSRDPTHRHDCFPAAHPVHPLTPRAARHGRGFSLALFCPAAHPETKVPRRLRPPGARCAHRAGRAARATPTPSTTRTLAQHTPAAAAQPATPRRRRGGSHPEPRCCHNHHRRR
jgi:hypothetical protein